MSSAAEATSVVLAEQIDVLQYCFGMVLVRVHAASLGGNDLTVQLQPDGHVAGDSTIYTTDGASYFGQPVGVSGTPGALCTAKNFDKFHGQFAMLVITASGALSATLSIDLLLRSPEDINNVAALAAAKSGGCCCNA